MENIKVSIIVPGYNVAEYLEDCLTSLVNQTLDEIQVIAINDGSTDETGHIMDKYEAKHPNFQVIHQKNQGF